MKKEDIVGFVAGCVSGMVTLSKTYGIAENLITFLLWVSGAVLGGFLGKAGSHLFALMHKTYMKRKERKS